MKNIIYITLLLSFISCNPLEKKKKDEEKPLSTNGVFSLCENSENVSVKRIVTINDYSLSETFVTYLSANCVEGNELLHEALTGSLERNGYDFKVTLKSYYVIPLSSNGTSILNSLGFCSLSWSTGTPESLIGRTCDGTLLTEGMVSISKVSSTGGKLTVVSENIKTTYENLGALNYNSQSGSYSVGKYFYHDGEVSYFVQLSPGDVYQVNAYNVLTQKKMLESGNIIISGNHISFNRTSGIDPCGDDDSLTDHLFKQTKFSLALRNTSDEGEEMDILFARTPITTVSAFESAVLNKTFTEGCPF